MGEFELIRRYFQVGFPEGSGVVAGIGDDAALVQVPEGMELVVATDTLVDGIHFPQGTDPGDVGYKALAVNLSDLAAMGATPAWFLLNLTMPSVDPVWLERFAEGLRTLAHATGIPLIGGDTTRGPLSITITVHGWVEAGTALRRRGARLGDLVYVTGFVGDAALGLAQWQGRLELPEEYREVVLERLLRPVPRLAVGRALRGVASAAIDISDGLAADLGHILTASGCGATLRLDRIPLSPAYDTAFTEIGWEAALTHGDDYELCFTIPEAEQRALHRLLPRWPCPVSQIGIIEAELGLRIQGPAGLITMFSPGHDHFRRSP